MLVGRDAAASATGAERSGSSWSRSHRPAGTSSLGGGPGGGFLLHLLDQLDGDSGVAGLVAVYGVRHPVGYHGVQNLQLGGAILTGQEVAGVDDLAGGKFGFHQPADLIQLVHQAEDDLSGGVVLHNEVGAVAVLKTARDEHITEKRGEDVDQPRAADGDNLTQRIKHRFQQDRGCDGEVAVHMILVVLSALGNGGQLAGSCQAHEACIS